MSMEQAFQTFIEESLELLQDMEKCLLNFPEHPEPVDLINSIFRAAHTIKGSAGLFGLDSIVAFTHVVESVLDRVRDNEISLSDELIGLMLECKDYIERQIDCIEGESVLLTTEDTEREAGLQERLNAYLNTSDSEPANAMAQVVPDQQSGLRQWHISVRFGEDVLRNGMDPASFVRYLKTLGTIEHINTIIDTLPPPELMDPESCYLGLEIHFKGDVDQKTLEDVFEFVREDSQIEIAAIEDLTALESIQAETTSPAPMLASEAEVIAADALKMGGRSKDKIKDKGKDKSSQSLRIDANKLDQLINLIGELVIAGAGIESEARAAEIESLTEATLPVLRLIEEVRDNALTLRMVQIGDTFNRFQRVVRDVSKELGKDIELSISGGETELDKSVIEKITDPLTHLVRNAIDHGIESRDGRVATGKAETGNVRLNAYHESGTIVIEVSDDGRGLDCDAILTKAYERGLIPPDTELTQQDIFQLIFEPGFSTAAQVSNISGRGVGMDVVRRNIEALRGSIEIESERGKGTLMRIRLPLTLAIIDGFLMGVGDSSFVVPLDIVEECIELPAEVRHGHRARHFINLRGEPLPFIGLREFFNEQGKRDKRENIVVVRYGNQRAGLVVDRLMGEFQTVIKPLGSVFQNLKGISGSTILGSGEVALILDAPALIQIASKQPMRSDEQALAANYH